MARGLVTLGCLCAVLALGLAAPLNDDETLVVTKVDDQLPSSTEATSSKPEEPTTEEPSQPIKLTEMDVRSEVTMRYAHTAVVTHVSNPAKRAQEATFRVLLPQTAFISGFTMTLDGKSYKAYVKEKEEAKQIYSQAVAQGSGAAHIAAKARDSNHFTVSVNVEPNTTAVFNLQYEELLLRKNKVYNHAINLHPGELVPKLTVTVHLKESQKITTLRVPAVRTGNEIDATEEDAQNPNAVIERSKNEKEATITFKPDIEEQKKLRDIYAEKTKQSRAAVSRWGYSASEDEPVDGVLGQFVVQYDVDRSSNGEVLVNDGYFVHFFAPESLPPLNKHVVFVLDTSGSMSDRKIVQLREAMQTILSELNPGDYFSLVSFASHVTVLDLKDAEKPPKVDQNYFYYYDKPIQPTLIPPYPATPENIAAAKLMVNNLNANGGTNIDNALSVAIELIQKGIGWKPTEAPPTEKTTEPNLTGLVDESSSTITPSSTTEQVKNTAVEVKDAAGEVKDADGEVKDAAEDNKLEPVIIFLTDGDPTVGETNTKIIINRIVERNSGERKASIFSLAFGEDADRNFLRKVSLKNEGFMRHIYEAADAALQLRDFYRQVASPLLADVHFVYPKDQIKEGSLTKHKFRTYYQGSEAVVAGRYEDLDKFQPKVYGRCGVGLEEEGKIKKRYEVVPPVVRNSGEYLPLERMWAYLTIKQLLDERDAAEDVDKPDKEDTSEDTPEKKALAIALKYEFVTPLTSLVVVKPNDTKAVDAESVDKEGPSFLPAGGYYNNNAMAFNSAPGLPGPPGAPGVSYAQFAAYPQALSVGQAFAPESIAADQLAYEEAEESLIELDGPIPSTPYQPSTTPQPSSTAAQVDLAEYHLEEFSWLQTLVNQTTDDIVVPTNQTRLRLTKDNVAPKTDSGDAECALATDGAPGLCVYLTRCEAAKTVTVDQYSTIYCAVSNEYAGICCPRDKVDVSH